MHQKEYIDSISEMKLSNILQRNRNDKLTSEDVSILGGALGKVTWTAGISGPEISIHVCKTSSRVKSVIISDVNTINKIIKLIKTMSNHITILVLNLEHALFGSLVPAMCNRTSCAQVHELPKSHCSDNRGGTLFS